MKAYGRDWWRSGPFAMRTPRSINDRFPSGQAISGPVSQTWMHRLIMAIAGH